MFGASRRRGILRGRRGLDGEKRREGVWNSQTIDLHRPSVQSESSVCRRFSQLGGLGISCGWHDYFRCKLELSIGFWSSDLQTRCRCNSSNMYPAAVFVRMWT